MTNEITSISSTIPWYKLMRSNVLYYVVFFLLTSVNVLGTINFNPGFHQNIDHITSLVGIVSSAILLFVAFVQIREKDITEAIFPAILIVCGLLVKIMSGDSTLLYLSLLISANEGVTSRGIARASLAALLLCLLFAVGMLALGLIEDVVILDERAILGSRYSLGFTHPNRLGKVLLGLATSIVLARLGFCRKVTFAIQTIIIIIALVIADSRTTVAALILLNVTVLFFDKRTIERKRSMIGIYGLVSMLTVATIVLSAFYAPDSAFFEFLNKLLSYRIEFWNAFLLETGISLFGVNVDAVQVMTASGSTAILDGAYATAIFRYGIIATLVIIFLFGGLTGKFNSENDRVRETIVLIVFIFVALTESYAFSPFSNFLLILAPRRIKEYRW